MSGSAQVDQLRPRRVARPTANWDGEAAGAAALSFLFPGLGQAFNGQRLLALMLAAPAALIALLLGLVLAVPGMSITTHLLDTRFLAGLIVLDVALLGWRVVAIGQAYAARQHLGRRGAGLYAAAVLIVATVGTHVLPAAYAFDAIETLNAVSLGGQSGGFGGDGPVDEGQAIHVPVPSEHPTVRSGERVNVLLVGIDSGFGRTWALTDTMLVVSIDPDGRSAMISVPRDTYGAPLPDGSTYNTKLNSLLVTAESSPNRYPLGGVATLKEAIGSVLGLKIHYFAAVNLPGFKQAVDAIGGVDIDVTRRIADPVYSEDGVQEAGFYLDPGHYHMDGSLALAYVRSRHGAGDSDFTRAARQQQVLAALQDKLTAGNLLARLPSLLDAVKGMVSTDIPSERIPDLAQAVQDADMSQLQRVVLQPPLMTPELHPTAGYILHPDFAAIQDLVRRMLTDESPAPSPQRSPGG